MFGVVYGSFLSKHQRNQQEFYPVPKVVVHKRGKKLKKQQKINPTVYPSAKGRESGVLVELEPVSTLGSKS